MHKFFSLFCTTETLKICEKCTNILYDGLNTRYNFLIFSLLHKKSLYLFIEDAQPVFNFLRFAQKKSANFVCIPYTWIIMHNS